MHFFGDLEDILERDRPLAPLTTWRIGGPAEMFFSPRTPEETALLLRSLSERGLAFRVLGGGANVLLDDRPHGVPYIHPGRLTALRREGDLWHVGAGIPFPRLVADASREGWGGLEVLAGIPGQMGGICRMNAGGRHGEIRDVVERVCMALPSGELRWFDAEEVGFAYRRTDLPPGVITEVVLRLRWSPDPAALTQRMGEILKAKSASQPLRTPSGGCVFANPEALSAGRLVEELGLKGRRRGGARISPQHGNFIVNEGGASFEDVLGLIEEVEKQALQRRGIRLRREVSIWRAEPIRSDEDGV